MWMRVKQWKPTSPQIPRDTIVNIDKIIRISVLDQRTYIRFEDGSSIDVVDSFDEIADVILKAQGK